MLADWICIVRKRKNSNILTSRFGHLEKRTLSKTAKSVGGAGVGLSNSVLDRLSLRNPSGDVKWTDGYMKLGLKREVWIEI